MNTVQDENTEWVAVDWGTSNLRAWIMGRDATILQDCASDDGMGALTPDQFEPALLALISPFLSEGTKTPVVACGMVGARQGWTEAEYAAVPCDPPGVKQATSAPVSDPRIDVRILPGVSQSAPADVMRGEETQIAGFLAKFPNFDGVLCLPGTHSKWARISAGEMVSFQTFMTGELFALLAGSSVLRHSVDSAEQDRDSFLAAMRDAMSNPERVAARLFSIRAGSLVSDLGPAAARATLSGLLIGLELAGARPYWLGMDIAIIGASSLADLYRQALVDQGVDPKMTDTTEMTLAGLTAAYTEWKEST